MRVCIFSQKGALKKHKEVNVYSRLQRDFISGPATLKHEMSSKDSVVSQEGQSVMLKCEADGVPHPNITWYKLTTSGSPQAQENPEAVLGELCFSLVVNAHPISNVPAVRDD